MILKVCFSSSILRSYGLLTDAACLLQWPFFLPHPRLAIPKSPRLIIQDSLQTLIATVLHHSDASGHPLTACGCLGDDSRASGDQESRTAQWKELPREAWVLVPGC